MRLSALSAAVLALCAVAALPADAAGLNTAFAAHRALYNLTLATSRGGEVVAARGTMGYEVIDACDGWAVRQRLSMTLTNTEGQDIQMVSDYATWESKDGLKFRFHMKQTTDTAVTSQTDGDAQLERTGGPGEVHYTVPRTTRRSCRRGRCSRWPIPRRSSPPRRPARGSSPCRCSTAPTISGPEDSSIVVLDWKKPEPNKYRCCPTYPARAFAWRSSTIADQRGPDLSGGHALLAERRGRQSADGLRRLRDERETGRPDATAAQVLRPVGTDQPLAQEQVDQHQVDVELEVVRVADGPHDAFDRP